MKPQLPERLQPYDADIVMLLKNLRLDGKCYPGHGVDAEALAKTYRSWAGVNCTARDIRKLVQYARLNVPEGNRIAGTPDEGYFFCLSAEEMKGTVAHLISEVATRNETIRKLKEAFTEQPELFPINSQAETEKSL